ncbi:TetR family transcriptional regulator [Gluconacetobacter sp. 1b LMG 1731]|uniref:TetR family transcriptional regulator n=1 Tax=Gluconacetobacter dulcium TaxID=2729096 RepID=A0A7W4K1P0_9PROT|nr:TetR family transcriptional regulator C-terminal domain-containing protein [Gluconacetobacter dulcium]MBB2165689.1 TetR family transcriptional regulator [Gluconacetobacter dulcium]MBB2194886.1 TetR family transcriptional regulator [Gluconacetobacter dulcium]MBB2198687.1 TetR family transcriptional regulator [Gluconacetobacter dulcium]
MSRPSPLAPSLTLATAQERPVGAPRRASTGQILRAAEREFGRDGYKGASMAGIAAAAGLPKANIHYYFGTKEDLYRAVLENILDNWLGDATVWIHADATPRAALEGYIRSKIAFSRDRPDASRIFAHEVLQGAPNIQNYFNTSLRDYAQTLEDVFSIWQRTGQMRPINGAHFLFCIWAMTQTYADMSAQVCTVLRKPALAEQDYNDAANTIITLILNGIEMT